MRGLEFFGICFVGGIILIMFAALIADIILRVSKKSKQRPTAFPFGIFAKGMKDGLQRRCPSLPIDKFTPIITMPSQCCGKMLWQYDSGYPPENYFCDACGKRYIQKYSWEKREYMEELEISRERDLAALNEFFATDFWAAKNKGQ